MFFSIITICYNCKNDINKTIESVLMQSFTDYEYIIIDGASKDGTVEIVNEYSTRHSCIHAVSEPDNGIYDAMNKGVGFAKGEYIIFLNAGDIFHSESVLDEAQKVISKDKLDIYYGDVVKEGRIVKQNQRYNFFDLVYLERMLCHQSIFAKRLQCKQHPFDLNFKICADRDWMIRRLCDSATTKYISGLIVCDYDTTGISSNYSMFQRDSLKIAEKYGGNTAVILVKAKRSLGKLVGHNY